MLISIITPLYNSAKYINQTIESVQSQTFEDLEYILVDDGSTDNTVEIAKEYAKLDSRIKLLTKPNGGVASARNFGFANIDPSSKYVAFLDHDDLWQPDNLQKLLTKLEYHPECFASHGLAMIIDSESNIVGDGIIFCRDRRKLHGHKVVPSNPDEYTTFHTMICACMIPTPGCVLFRREALENVSQDNKRNLVFDSDMLEGDDWDLYLRLCLNGQMAFVDEPLLLYRKHESNRSSDKDRQLIATYRVWRKIRANPKLTSAQKDLADWRYRREYATVERHNVEVIGRRLKDSVRKRQALGSVRLLLQYLNRYAWYIQLRWNIGLGGGNLPIPRREA
jgi:glycosyltransferase involved in cell wall biosynthesis